MGNASCRCAGGRQRPATMRCTCARQSRESSASANASRSRVSASRYPPRRSTMKPAASARSSALNACRLIHPADGSELVRGELLTSKQAARSTSARTSGSRLSRRASQDVVELFRYHDRAVRLDRRGQLLDEEGVAVGLAPDRLDHLRRDRRAVDALHHRGGRVSREWPEGDLACGAFGQQARAHLRQRGTQALPLGRRPARSGWKRDVRTR